MKKCRTNKKSLTSGLSDEAGWRYYLDDDFPSMPQDCKDLLENGQTITGVYDIYPYDTLTIPAIQKRIDGSVIFDRNWMDYKNGFGSPEQNVWVGDAMLDTGSSIYDLSGMYFSTPDRDNDGWGDNNCAAYRTTSGGWWFRSCHSAFLNGPWSPGSWSLPWYPTVQSGASVKGTTLMIRRN
ncbi:ficolin-1-like [Saccostrea cucullata]|uniref:ficolin-1-like n=1 Tax=Saccostrea cuccullata TaxID=36930 RepID=UPI002ED10863